MAKGQRTSDDIRAQVIAAILAGEGVSEISRRLQLDKSIISRIKNTVAPEKLQQVTTEKQQEVNDLICNYLAANFKAMTTICTVLSDADYLRKYSPPQLIEAHEGLSAKAFQLIEAESNEGEDNEDGG